MAHITKDLLKRKAIEKAWTTGNLKYKLLPHQYQLYDAIMESDNLTYVVNCTRRFGKTTVLCIIALETCLPNELYRVCYAAPFATQVRSFICPVINQLAGDAPVELKPTYVRMDNQFTFPLNGSQIKLAGTDHGNAENLRGAASNMNIIDEAAFCTDLKYVLHDILMPQTLTTAGRTIIASTPPRSPDHEYIEIAQTAMLKDAYSHFTIYDWKGLDPKVLENYIQEAGGRESTTFRREYMAEFVTDVDSMIVPEWDEGRFAVEVKRDSYYPLYHKYEAMDIGGAKDKTVVLYGYYDFRNARLVVEDESVLEGNSVTTQTIAREIRTKEQMVFGSSDVWRRVADSNNAILLQDLASLHGISFGATSKDTLRAMVNEVRLWVQDGRLQIDPKCKELIACLNFGVWRQYRRVGVDKMVYEFARSATLGHFDALAALVYMIRNVDQHTNPIPSTYQLDPQTTYINAEYARQQNGSYAALEKAFGVKRKR